MEIGAGIYVLIGVIVMFIISSLLLDTIKPFIEKYTNQPLKNNRMTAISLMFFLGGVLEIVTSLIDANEGTFYGVLFGFVLLTGAYLFYKISQQIAK